MNAHAVSPGDLSACEREPIHIPGSIQPHGVLLALDRSGLTVVHASENLERVLGCSAAAALGRMLEAVAPPLHAALAADLMVELRDDGARYLRTVTLPTPAGERAFDAVVHPSADLLVLELEEVAPGDSVSLDALYPAMRGFVEQLQSASGVEALCRLAAEDVRRITGFDRVLVYRFDEHWNGTVIAEDRNDVLPSYFDLRFPASDIPAQARELYRRNRLRIIPDADYAPVPVVPTLHPGTRQPLDLSYSVLRSVSPVHLEYMRNMGTMASMSISILREGALWGLISCHNRDARRVPLRVRNACDFLTQIFSLQLAARERAAEAEELMRLGSVRSQLLGFMAEEERFINGLIRHPAQLLDLAGADGAAIVSGERCWLLGSTPPEADVRRLYEWLSAHCGDDVFVTDALASLVPEAEAYGGRASGLLAIAISKVNPSYVLWFRPEVIHTVKWGGDPQKPVRESAGPPDAPVRLHPRKSFEIWKETVRGRSLPWKPAEIETVKDLRNAIVGIVLRRAEELAALSEELQRTNKELEAFSYSVSHDLRAPFRHIVGYSELLRKQEGGTLSERGRRYVETIIESAYTAGTLVDNLLSFSQMGRASLKPRPIDMNVLVAEVRRSFALDVKERRIDWRVGPLATVRADPVMLRLAVENLVSNALKYTRSRSEAVIEIGCDRRGDEVVFFVRDNGVGFDMAYVGKLFGVFQRLHRMEEFEGTGIGLANVRRIVERHGGRVWAEGAVEKGATFFFALPATGAH
ncbi:MAG TPA: ATP-binding protein [Microvirga sp.]|jgi:light-regulated signal transduction histidine kinase (bacteriophytochrome)|nr:ATP-binding protein [Microvirga sp.]